MNQIFITIIMCGLVASFGLNILCFQSIGFLKKDVRSLEKELWNTQMKEFKKRE